MSDLERAKALFENALTAYGSEQYAETAQLLRQALQLAPDRVSILTNLAAALLKLDRPEEAMEHARRSIEVKSECPEGWLNVGGALLQLKRYDEAVTQFDRAIELNPGLAEAWSNRGNVLNELKRHDEALASCDRAIELNPGLAEAWSNRGNVLTELSRYDEALASLDRAVALRPGFAEAWSNRGLALLCIKRHVDALASFQRATTLSPDYALGHFNEGIARLALGDFERGWKKYEWRWKTGKIGEKPLIDAPLWDGRRVAGTLFALCEQGLGDQILHMSMLREARRLAGDLLVALEPRLVVLARRSFPDIRFVSNKDPLPAEPLSAWIPMGDLGGHFRQAWSDFSKFRTPYLSADPDRSARLRKKLTRKNRTVCGLSWDSKNAHFGNQKSIRLQDMLEVLRIPGIEFVDLQYGNTRQEREELFSRYGVSLTHLDEVDNTLDIDGLAALIGACDMVVTISNTTAHLAGALGQKPFVMVPYSHGRFWYWHEDREDSPWYPCATLIRQPQPNDWSPVFSRIAGEMRKRLTTAE